MNEYSGGSGAAPSGAQSAGARSVEAGVAGAADVNVRLEVWPDMIHAWHLFYQEVAGGRRALAEAGAFIRSNLG